MFFLKTSSPPFLILIVNSIKTSKFLFLNAECWTIFPHKIKRKHMLGGKV